MVDRSRAAVEVTHTRIGRTDLGPSTVVVEDDALLVVVRSTAEDRPIRIPLTVIDAAPVEGDDVTLIVRDGTRITLGSPSAGKLAREIVARCHVLPELTRTLRAFGSRRGRRTAGDQEAAEQQRFFEPLMAARRSAIQAEDPVATVSAFSAVPLQTALDETLAAFAADRHGDDAPARRALEAELVDLSEPLQHALHALGSAAEAARGAPDDLRLWRAWAAQLRAVFEAADRVWVALGKVLDSPELRRPTQP